MTAAPAMPLIAEKTAGRAPLRFHSLWAYRAIPISASAAASLSGSAMGRGILTRQEPAADQPNAERHNEAGERLLLDLPADRLDRPPALLCEAAV